MALVSDYLRPPAWLVLLGAAACGDRTGLSPGTTGGSSGDGGGRSAASCAPDPTSSLVVTQQAIQAISNVAGSGCSFGMTWQENRAGELVNVARTAYAAGGNWVLSPPVTIAGGADLGVDGNAGFIGWDGVAFTVAWTTGGVLFLRRMAVDGTLLGPAVRSVTTGVDSYVLWIDPSPGDGTLRMALLDDRSEQYHYRVYYLKLTPDGRSVVPAVPLTPEAESPSTGGFIHLPSGDNAMFWSGDNDVTMTFFESFFDEAGALTRPATSVLRPLDASQGSYLPGGAARVGDSTYFGVLAYEQGPQPIVGVITSPGAPYAGVSGIPGADVPVIAATDSGVVGVLSDRTRNANSPSDLLLAFVTETTSSPAQVVARGEGLSDEYALAGGSSSFGVFWQTSPAEAKFTVRTP